MTGIDGDWLRHNRESWDDRVRVHADSDFYDLSGFRAGAYTLRAFELDEVGDVSGRRLLHHVAMLVILERGGVAPGIGLGEVVACRVIGVDRVRANRFAISGRVGVNGALERTVPSGIVDRPAVLMISPQIPLAVGSNFCQKSIC